MSEEPGYRCIAPEMVAEIDSRHLEAVAMIASAGMAFMDFDPQSVKKPDPQKSKRLFDFPTPIGI
jgi:hypothetical protein